MTAIRPSAKPSVITAVSTSPSAPMAGSMMLAPSAVTDTGSAAKSQHAMSRSWMAMSRNSPPELLTYVAGVEGALERGKVRIEAAVEADHHRPAGLGRHRLAGQRAFEVQVHRLFAQHGLAGMHRRFDQRRMGVGGGGDQYRIDAGVGNDLLRRPGLGPAGGGQLLRRWRVDVSDGQQLAALIGNDAPGVHLADTA